MNDRIRELAEQAGITTNIDTDYFEKDINKWVDYYSQKFAELIVQECASMARVYCSHEFDFTGDLELDEFMLKHFGVKS